jgi:glycosyltransferase involved in cell wall biosynthesis
MFDINIILDEESERSGANGRAAPVRHLALIGNALPRKCGIATFTSHVADALRERFPAMKLDHYAMDDGSGVEYPSDIRTITADDSASYRDAAADLERSGAEAVWLQHEYGIFGGPAGSHILELVSALHVPLIVTLHTVLENPSETQEVVLERLLARAEKVIVMAARGAEILQRRYGVPADHIQVIPHGVPDRSLRESSDLKSRFGWQEREMLMTFGLLAPDKGIRHMIEAMPAIVAAHPQALYAVVGATHPNLVRNQGEALREELIARAQELGVDRNIQFIDSFVEQEELLDMLQASDVYVTPYLNMAQVTSGTLSYAVAVGKPVVATPYIHAQEILADGHGIIVPPGDPAALADAVIKLLDDERLRDSLARAAYERGRTMLWPLVVERALLPLADRTRTVEPRPAPPRAAPLPLEAVQRMSDAVGIMQHAVYSVPDRDHGYCIDDNARALMLTVRRGSDPESRLLEHRYAAFVQHGWNPDVRRFRNFMGYDRRWLEESGSDDSNGRAIWALGVAAAFSPDEGIRDWALYLFNQTAPHVAELDAPRTRTFAALGGAALLEAHPDHAVAKSLLEASGEQLAAMHRDSSRHDWNWFEAELAYDNARLPEALIRAGMALGDNAKVELGLSTLRWLISRQTGPRGTFRPVGSNGFGRAYAPPLAFDQQPVEAWATIDACAAAFAATGHDEWKAHARHSFGWFFGDNDAGIPLADAADGSCFDGLMATGINRNQGAESILALHLAALTMRQGFASPKRAGQGGDIAPEASSFALSNKVHDSIKAPSAPA